MALFSGGFSATSAEALHAMNNAGKDAPNDALRVALYLRVSTHDQQTLPLQLHALQEYAHRRGWQVVQEVAEVASGAAAVKRPKRDALLQAAKRREVDAILVWRLDRWGRSVADLVNSLAELEAVGVAFVSVTEALDLTTPAGRAMAAMVAVFAQFEREILKERVKAGIAQARAKGKAMGRPPTAAGRVEEMRVLQASGISQAGIARRLGVGRTSVRRLLKSQDFKSQDLILNGQETPRTEELSVQETEKP